ncbi:Uncharacterized conserved protein, DUF924 family [Enhydrobacter aerosaccus]|uniref:Uncharacterized conserved protein, DUF924 family n=1 Tax=Enhydrobacter aerosaccus TaxID=225324 RepID=A0A1T4QF35_9HYPH|nr:DUF924 family protein [Enhydrobacter aerosaccus]SKA02324.1 Uncharacterized conserved protein, DUF924 family [Enhydrobacter aerosaccus]
MNDDTSIREILDFWFLPLADPGHGRQREIWWKSTPAFDAEIRTRFAALLERAIGGALDHWMQSPDGTLALIVLCDQFSRNMYRGAPRAFSGDAKALQAARVALARFYPAIFPADMRGFFYMPFQHSEALADQELCCALFSALGGAENVKFAFGHRDIIARFGRFPHRNDVLARPCSPEELDYLKSADRFGQ